MVLLALALGVVPAQAQEEAVAPAETAQPPAAAPQPVESNVDLSEPHGKWNVRCFRVELPTPCDILQVGTNPETQQRVHFASIAYNPFQNNYPAQIGVPLGVALSRGLTLNAGEGTISGVRFSRCERDGCYVELTLPTPTVMALQALTADTTISVVVYGTGEEITMPISVDGFNAALERMRAESMARAVEVTPQQ